MPFENQSKVPGLDWISESFPEVLTQRMASPGIFIIRRDDRTFSFNQAGVPSAAKPSRATIYRVAEQMDADYVVLGSYDFDGQTFHATAQLLNMKKLHLGPEVQGSGPLKSLIDIQTGLAWDLLQQFPAPPTTTREQFLRAAQPIQLDAFENYVRGELATTEQQKVRYFREALRLDPNYTKAKLRLGQAYFDNHEYESAASWFGRIPKDDPLGGEALFLLGMSEFFRGSFDRSYAAFSALAARLPLTEVYNNLGVVESRRGHRSAAVEYFTKAVNADPTDADYRFNLAVALFKNGDSVSAARQLREELQQRPSDGEAKTLLDAIGRGVTAPAPAYATAQAGSAMFPVSPIRIPQERIKQNYDETSYRQLELEIHNLTEQRLAAKDPHSHAQYHVDRGRELIGQGHNEQAEAEFREAVNLDPNNAAAHAGLAKLLLVTGDNTNARTQAEASVRIKPNVDALLVLAQIDMKESKTKSAADEVNRALSLEPANATALALQRDINARQAANP